MGSQLTRPATTSSLRISAKTLLKHVRDRWSIENSWHWPRDTQLKEDGHRCREVNGIQIMATLRSLAMNALRLDGFGRSPSGWPPWPTTSGGQGTSGLARTSSGTELWISSNEPWEPGACRVDQARIA
jgi:hypothetical protein